VADDEEVQPARISSHHERISRHYTTVRPARLEHLVLVDPDELDEDRDDELEICVRRRANDGGRFDEVLAGRAGLSLETLPPWARHEIARCQHYATLHAEAPAGRARELLQAAEALLVEWAQNGQLSFALDCLTWTWRRADEIKARSFSVEQHFTVVVEAVERQPGAGHLVRTRGLAKFALPEIGMRAPRAEAERVSEWVREVGRRGAEGEPLQPGRRITVGGRGLALWPRSEDCLSAAPRDEAPLYELREGGLSVVR
jgi:hypothetical protein